MRVIVEEENVSSLNRCECGPTVNDVVDDVEDLSKLSYELEWAVKCEWSLSV